MVLPGGAGVDAADGIGDAGAAEGAADCTTGAGVTVDGTAFAAFGAPFCGTQAATARSSGIVTCVRTVRPKLIRCPFPCAAR
jgi:hypothetical protein